MCSCCGKLPRVESVYTHSFRLQIGFQMMFQYHRKSYFQKNQCSYFYMYGTNTKKHGSINSHRQRPNVLLSMFENRLEDLRSDNTEKVGDRSTGEPSLFPLRWTLKQCSNSSLLVREAEIWNGEPL